MMKPAGYVEWESQCIPKPGVSGHLCPLDTDKSSASKLWLSKVGEDQVKNLAWQLLLEAIKLSSTSDGSRKVIRLNYFWHHLNPSALLRSFIFNLQSLHFLSIHTFSPPLQLFDNHRDSEEDYKNIYILSLYHWFSFRITRIFIFYQYIIGSVSSPRQVAAAPQLRVF